MGHMRNHAKPSTAQRRKSIVIVECQNCGEVPQMVILESNFMYSTTINFYRGMSKHWFLSAPWNTVDHIFQPCVVLWSLSYIRTEVLYICLSEWLFREILNSICFLGMSDAQILRELWRTSRVDNDLNLGEIIEDQHQDMQAITRAQVIN